MWKFDTSNMHCTIHTCVRWSFKTWRGSLVLLLTFLLTLELMCTLLLLPSTRGTAPIPLVIQLVPRCQDSSVGRALDWRSKGPWFDPGSWHYFFFLYSLSLFSAVATCLWRPVLRDTTSMSSAFYHTRGSPQRRRSTTSTPCSEEPPVEW